MARKRSKRKRRRRRRRRGEEEDLLGGNEENQNPSSQHCWYPYGNLNGWACFLNIDRL